MYIIICVYVAAIDVMRMTRFQLGHHLPVSDQDTPEIAATTETYNFIHASS